MIVYCKKFMERVEKEISFLDSEKKHEYLDIRIDWLDNYENLLEVILSDKRLDPYVICEENKQQIIDENKLNPGDWDVIHSIIPPEDWSYILYRLYKKEIKRLITNYRQNKQDKRLDFLLSKMQNLYDLVYRDDLYNNNVDPFIDFMSIEKAVEIRLSDVKSLKNGCQHLGNYVQSKNNSEEDGTNHIAKQGQNEITVQQVTIENNSIKILSNELGNAHTVIKRLKKQKLVLHLSMNEMKDLIDKCRKKNDLVNLRKLGRELGIHHSTARNWIEIKGLSEYAKLK